MCSLHETTYFFARDHKISWMINLHEAEMTEAHAKFLRNVFDDPFAEDCGNTVALLCYSDMIKLIKLIKHRVPKMYHYTHGSETALLVDFKDEVECDSDDDEDND